jgi:hypothetical protein
MFKAKQDTSYTIGTAIGFLLMLKLFSGILFVLLYLWGKLSRGHEYFYVLGFAALASLAGYLLRRWLR